MKKSSASKIIPTWNFVVGDSELTPVALLHHEKNVGGVQTLEDFKIYK